MAALTGDRNTVEMAGRVYEGAPNASVTVYKGALVALNASGEIVPGSTATTLKALGRAENSTLDQGYGGRIRAKRGTFRFANSTSGDLIAASDYGATCYIVDDQTVAKTNGSSTRSVAGIVRGVDAQGVWVEI